MKLIKIYEEFIDSKLFESVTDKAITDIQKKYTEYDVKNLVDEEIAVWVSDEHEDIKDAITEINEDDELNDYQKKHEIDQIKRDWYYDGNGSGEAEEMVVDILIDKWENSSNVKLSDEDKESLRVQIIEAYSALDPNNY